MQRIKDILDILERKFPLYLKEEFDNVGLMVGNKQDEVKKILVALDPTERVVDEAISLGVNLIITHHPLIFKNGVQRIDYSNSLGRITMKAIRNDITIYSMHTNLDKAQDGMNDYLANLFELQDISIDVDDGFIRYGNLLNEKSLLEFSNDVKSKLELDNVTLIANDDQRVIKRVALCSGSGKDSIKYLSMKKDVDCYITGDVTYHRALDALAFDLPVIDAGHFGTEIIVKKVIKNYLLGNDVDVEIVESTSMKNPMKIV